MVVAGGGPAGATAARLLALRGHDVVVLDKARFPRSKPCAGGLQAKTLKLLDLPLEDVLERQVTRMRISAALRDPFVRESAAPIVHTVDRSRFDTLLLDTARAAGARVEEGERVRGATEEADRVRVETSRGCWEARAVIGADGARGTVRHSLFPGGPPPAVVGVAVDLHVSESDLRRFSSTIVLDWGGIPGGYAWIFPKRDRLSAGAAAPRRLAAGVQGYLERFVESLRESGELGGHEARPLAAHLLPMVRQPTPLASSRALLAGDAAGLIDAFSGEGIYYAVLSGRMAATAVDGFIRAGRSLHEYSRELEQTIMPELRSAWSVMYLFNAWPAAFHEWLRRSDRLWNAMARSFQGEKSYVSWKQELGWVQCLWPAIDAATGSVTACRAAAFHHRSSSATASGGTR